MSIATASKSSLMLSPCRHWMTTMAAGGDHGSESAQFGTAVHKAVEEYLVNGNPSDGMGETYGKPAKELLATLGAETGYLLEQPMFFALGGTCGFIESYDEVSSLRALCGTADVVYTWTDPDNRKHGMVLDWKTGNGWYAKNQLKSLGAMLAEIEELDTVRLISVELRPGEAKVALDFQMTRLELAFHLEKIMNAIQVGPTAPVVGAHCYELFCPHRENCKGIKDTYYAANTPDKRRLGMLNDDQLYQAFVAAKVSESNAAALKKRIQEECTGRGGLKLENGQVFQESFRSVSRLNQSELIALALSKGASEADIEKCKRDCLEGAGWRLKK